MEGMVCVCVCVCVCGLAMRRNDVHVPIQYMSWVWHLGFRDWSLGFVVWDFGFGVWGLGFRGLFGPTPGLLVF